MFLSACLYNEWTLLRAAEDSRKSMSLWLELEDASKNPSFSVLEVENSCDIGIQTDEESSFVC